MHVLDLLTIMVAGLLVGNEFAVSAFVNPAIWKHADRRQAVTLAASLGSVMPIWYAVSLVLLGTEAVLRRAGPDAPFFWLATGLWLAVIVLTIAALVPINSRLARLSVREEDHSSVTGDDDWLRDHHLWDRRHRIRVAFLTLALAIFGWGVLGH